ncbi:MAG: carbohydrate binding domain-containing protein, partial [Lentisphaeria bacterium]|nr:carbohydrate binding domain-containing protein [Lentisphaeria bacterium]
MSVRMASWWRVRAGWTGVLVLACLPGLGAAVPGGARQNLLSNGGFEEGTAGWVVDTGHRVVLEAGEAHGGKACLFGEVSEPNRHWQLTRDVQVSSRNLYEFEIWVRATKRTKLVLWALPPGEKARRMIEAWENVPAAWTRYAVPIVPGRDGVLQLQLIVPSSHGAPPGAMWVDDIALYETVLPGLVQVTDGSSFNDEPAMAAGGDGALYLAWNRFADGNDSLMTARWVPGGDGEPIRAGEWRVAGGPGTYILHPRVVSSPDGVEVLYAAEVREDDWDVFRVAVSAAGPARPVPVASLGGIDIKPCGAWSAGGLVACWESNGSGPRRIVFADSGRGGRGEKVIPLSSEAGSAYAPSLALLAGGEIAVAWHAFRDGNYDVFLRRRSAEGVWGAETRLTRAPGIDRHPRLAARGDELWLAYEHAVGGGYRTGATNQRRLILARIGTDGSLAAPEPLLTSPIGGRCEGAELLFDGGGRLWVVHLRPRGRRSGWDAFAVPFLGGGWGTAQRLSGGLGMDRP